MSNCQSCGMPMTKPEDYGGGQPGNTYCKYCTDDQGKLLPKEKVREKMIQFQMQSLNKTREQAETDVDKHMALMSAWKIGGPAVIPDSPSKVTVPDRPAMPPRPSPVKPSLPLTEPSALPGVKPTVIPSPVAKPVPKPAPSGIGTPKPTELGVSSPPTGQVSDEPPVKPETPPTKLTFEPSVSKPKPEPYEPKEPSTEPLVDLTEKEPSGEPSESEKETSPGIE